uniref:sphingomyelin phosphodiesterase n=1 Tax=Timema shepardi TaxID=629360 RepID=A0A7R9G2C4_TIMSH|nr:unnamed protein product [Timema shepardi]
MYVSNKYTCRPAKWLDLTCYHLMHPFITYLSNFVSCYVRTLHEKHFDQSKLYDYLMYGPLYAALCVICAPFGLFGILLWVFLCSCFHQEKYTLVSFDDEDTKLENLKTLQIENDTIYTIGTVNLLLATEILGRLNNIKHSDHRCQEIAKRILNHSCELLNNVEFINHEPKINSKQDSIVTEFPNIDFLCLQEVWERSYALGLITILKQEFKYFLYDVGEYTVKINCCMLGSGLMFASKKPILDVDFKTFTKRIKHAKYASQGVLCVKVALHSDRNNCRHVGYISNLHTQAYQGEENVIANQLSETRRFVADFKEKTHRSTDVVEFDIICGDFNADNMSIGDAPIHNHRLFYDYEDFCMAEPGQDHGWAIGTEMRQPTMYSSCLKDPFEFKKVLEDDMLRRMFILDADVTVHNTDLATKMPCLDSASRLEVLHNGGKRRVDKILTHKLHRVKVLGYAFLTTLTNLTDHLPVVMTFQVKHNRSL